jgi:putative pyrroloquinoline-quinone binding quinoprotein
MAAVVLALALAVTACGGGTPIGSASAPHATPPPTQTPTPVPSLATTWRIIPSPNPPSLPNSRLVAGTPLAAGGLVYVGSITGVVTALDAADGRVRWHYDARGLGFEPVTVAQ